MKTTTLKSLISSVGLASLVTAAACGGAQKSGGAGKTGSDVPPPPEVKNTSEPTGKTIAVEPKREISKDAKSDYLSAYAAFTAAEKGGWSEATCKQVAEKFESVAREHSKLVEAAYGAGLAYHRCNLFSDAEKAYRKALSINSQHPHSLSNLGGIYFAQGKKDDAKKYWDTALKASGKLSGAYVGTASIMMDDLKKTAPGPGWTKLAEEISFNLSSALAVDSSDVATYTAFGQFYLLGSERNKNRLDLAKLLLDEGEKRNAKYAPLKNTRGLLLLRRNNLSEALKQFQAAVELDPNFLEARMNVGLITLGFRKFDTSKEQFTKVLEKQPKNYDAVIGLGVAMRGLGDFDGAEAQYKKAKDLDGRRGESYFNLGVLYKDFKAAKQADLSAGKDAYAKAKEFFREFLSKDGSEADKAEANENIKVCDKNIKMMENFIKNQQANPPAPPAPPAK